MTIVDKILKNPDAIIIFSQLQTRITEEAKRRHEFREWLDEDKKAEFVNGEVIMHSPVKKKHSRVSKLLTRITGIYAEMRGLGAFLRQGFVVEFARGDWVEANAIVLRAPSLADQSYCPKPGGEELSRCRRESGVEAG